MGRKRAKTARAIESEQQEQQQRAKKSKKKGGDADPGVKEPQEPQEELCVQTPAEEPMEEPAEEPIEERAKELSPSLVVLDKPHPSQSPATTIMPPPRPRAIDLVMRSPSSSSSPAPPPKPASVGGGLLTSLTSSPSASRGSATPGATTKIRIRWTTEMEDTLLDALVEVVKRGKTSDGFKKVHWVEAADKVRPLYSGRGDLSWDRVKSKFDDKFRPVWGKWKEHVVAAGSGWTSEEDGLLQASEEVMDTYFRDHPDFEKEGFRYHVPQGLRQLEAIFGDRVATGEHAIAPDAESSDSDEEIEWPASDEEAFVRESIERSKSQSVDVSATRASSVATTSTTTSAMTARKSKKQIIKDTAKEGVRKRMEEAGGRNRESKATKLGNKISASDGKGNELMERMLESYNKANPSHSDVIKLVKRMDGFTQLEKFRVYDLLNENEAQVCTLLSLAEEERSAWLRYQLDKV